jgi:hypothetical protein
MPTIAIVNGILIMFYTNDHEPPHFHAQGAGFEARIAIADGSVLDYVGKMPRSTRRLLGDWAAEHREALMTNWTLARARQPLNRIEP